MLEDSFRNVYDKFKFHFYRKVFDVVKEREGSLSVMEAFSLEVIKMLHQPTVGQFAEFLNISQSNATYKINNLIKKGYIERTNSSTDHREYYLILSEKYYRYSELFGAYEDTVMNRVKDRCTPEEVATFDKVLRIISADLMPEVRIK